MLTGHHNCPDEKALPVQSAAQGGLIICQTHVGNEGGKTHISGMVKKSSPGSVSSTSVHLDITAKRKGKVIRAIATDFFPRTIPETRQGVQGRSKFSLEINELPPDAEVTVTVHHTPIHRCPHFAKK